MGKEARAPRTGAEIAIELLGDEETLRKLRRMARSRFGITAEDVGDLLQETAVELIESRGAIRNPQGFVARIFYTRCCRFIGKRSRERGVPRGTHGGGGRSVSIEDVLAIRQVMAAMPEGPRRLVASHYIEGKSLRETAAEYGGSEKQVWKRTDASLAKMKRALEGV